MVMGMIFEAVADLIRWDNDKRVNNYKVKIVRKDRKILYEKDGLAADLKVGDIILLENECKIPADCILLSTDDPLG